MCLQFSQHLGVDKGVSRNVPYSSKQLIAASILAHLLMVIIPGVGQTNLFIFYFFSIFLFSITYSSIYFSISTSSSAAIRAASIHSLTDRVLPVAITKSFASAVYD